LPRFGLRLKRMDLLMLEGEEMTIYLICKHQKFRDFYGSGIYKAFVVDDAMESKERAKAITERLNRKAQKYFYKVKKVVL